MGEYRLANGHVLTDEEIEQECEKYESGEWEGHLVLIGKERDFVFLPGQKDGENPISANIHSNGNSVKLEDTSA